MKKLAWNSTFKKWSPNFIYFPKQMGENGNSDRISLGSRITADGNRSHEIKRYLLLGGKAMTNLSSILKSRDIADKGPSSQSYGFSSSHAWMWVGSEGAPKNWCFWTVVFEKTLEIPLDCMEIKPVNPKGNPSWIFTGRTDAKAPILRPLDAKSLTY